MEPAVLTPSPPQSRNGRLERQLEVLRGRNGNLLAEKRHLKQKCLSDIEVLKERFARERDREAAEQRDLSEAHEKAMDKMEARLRAQAAEHDRVMAVAERAHQDTKEEVRAYAAFIGPM